MSKPRRLGRLTEWEGLLLSSAAWCVGEERRCGGNSSGVTPGGRGRKEGKKKKFRLAVAVSQLGSAWRPGTGFKPLRAAISADEAEGAGGATRGGGGGGGGGRGGVGETRDARNSRVFNGIKMQIRL